MKNQELMASMKIWEERLEVMEAILWATKHFNQIIFLITTAKNVADAKKQLEEKYRFNKIQAEMVVNMRVNSFTKERMEGIEKEVQECQNKVDFYKHLISES